MIELRRRYSGGMQSPSHSRLPKEYQEVEYLEDSGTQYISVYITKGFNGTINAKASIPAILGSTNIPKYRFIVGWNDGPQIALMEVNYTSYWHNYNTTDKLVNIKTIYETKLEILGDSSSLFVNDEFVVENNMFKAGYYLGVFNNTSYRSTPLFGRIYHVEIIGTSNLSLIPCYRKIDNVTGMYDLVSGEFYTNAGGGEFIVGPNVIG